VVLDVAVWGEQQGLGGLPFRQVGQMLTALPGLITIMTACWTCSW
jgi:hypothetical protein